MGLASDIFILCELGSLKSLKVTCKACVQAVSNLSFELPCSISLDFSSILKYKQCMFLLVCKLMQNTYLFDLGFTWCWILCQGYKIQWCFICWLVLYCKVPGDALHRKCYKSSLWCDSKEKCEESRFALLDEQESPSNHLSIVVNNWFIFNHWTLNKHVFSWSEMVILKIKGIYRFVSVFSIKRKKLNAYLVFPLNIFSNNHVDKNRNNKRVFLNVMWTKSFSVEKSDEIISIRLILFCLLWQE